MTAVPTADESLGQRIRRARLHRSMTLEDLALTIRISAPELARIEAGRSRPDCRILMRLVLLAGFAEYELMSPEPSREDDLLRFAQHLRLVNGLIAGQRGKGH